MIQLLEDGFGKSTVQDRINYGIKLTKELQDFTSTFLPHMKEEEEVAFFASLFNSLLGLLSLFQKSSSSW